MTTWSQPERWGREPSAMPDVPLRLETRPCVACGGEIRADLANPGPGVRRHNEGGRHRAWCAKWRPEWLDEGVSLEVQLGGGVACKASASPGC